MPLPQKRYDTCAGVAQWLESLPSKQTVVGSSPIARSIYHSLLLVFREFLFPKEFFLYYGRIAQLVRAQH